MNEIVFGKQWLAYAAGILEAQDKVDDFRSKVSTLVPSVQLATSVPRAGVFLPTSTCYVIVIAA